MTKALGLIAYVFAALFAVVVSTVGAPAQAQRAASSASGSAVVSDPSGDSTLVRLAAAAANAPSDAALWHRYGKASSEATRPQWRKGVMSSTKVANLVIAAESSLARAVRLAPDSVQYALDLAAHLFGVSPTNLSRAEQVLEGAYASATRLADAARASRIADQLGVLAWRRYETVGDRRALTIEPRLVNFLTHSQEFWTWYEINTYALKPPLGVSDETLAAERFRRARLADPTNVLAARHELMVPLEHGRWEELLAIGREQASRAATLPWPWLAQGIAHHRLQRAALAAEAFDRGLALLSTDERAALAGVQRVLSGREAARYAALPDSARSRADTLFWNVGNPSLLLPGNVFRSEFLARVVHAELRFSNEEASVRGVDTDRGEALIRFGVPDIRASFKIDRDTAPNAVWAWTPLRLHLFFRQAPLYGTSLMSQTYRSEVFEPVVLSNPSFFGSLPGVTRGRDSLVVQAARFRGAGDSADVALFVGLRTTDEKRKTPTEVDSTDLGVFALDPSGSVVSRALRAEASPTGARPALDLTWRVAIAPGSTGLRVDARRPRDGSVARWMSDFRSTLPSGFSLSDLLVSARVTPPTAAATGLRWHSYDVAPNPTGVFSRSRPLDFLWEIYDLAPSTTGHAYRLSITLQKEDGKGARAVLARVLGVATNAVGVTSPDRNSIVLSYDRIVPASPVVTEVVKLDISGAPSGVYRVTISVADKTSGRAVQTQRLIRLAD